MKTEANTYEQLAAAAFDAQSEVFDQFYGKDAIIEYKRERVRKHLLQFLQPGNSVLELNCGTGEDAIYLAQFGCNVHATDIAAGMLRCLQKKVEALNLENTVTSEPCSFTELHQLKDAGPYDHVFSNFAGLNCTANLDKVLGSLSRFLKPGGKVTLVLLPRFCLWESLLVFKGKFICTPELPHPPGSEQHSQPVEESVSDYRRKTEVRVLVFVLCTSDFHAEN